MGWRVAEDSAPKKTGGWRLAEPEVEPSKDIPVGVKAPEPEPNFIQRLGSRAKALGQTVATGAGAVVEAARHPIDTFSSPAKVSNLARGMDDMLTFGYGQRVADWANEKLGREPSWAPTQEEMQQESRFRAAGNLLGAFTPGGANLAGKAGAKLASKVLPQTLAGTSRAAGAGLGAARGALGYQVGAVPTAMAQAHAAGGDPIEAARETAGDPLGLTLSLVGGTVAGGARGQAAKYRDPKTIEGQTLQTIEREGGRVSPVGQPVKGGTFDAPEIAGLKEGRKGMNQLAGKSRDAMKSHNRELLKNARSQYGEQVDGILAEHAGTAHFAENTHSLIDDLLAENRSSQGKVIDKITEKKLGHVRKLLSTDAKMEGGKTVNVPAAVDVGDILKVKKFVQDSAEWGKPSTPKNRPYRLISKALNDDAAAIDPRIQEINASYAKTMGQLEEANDILFQVRGKNVPKSAAADKRAALKLGRIGDDTQSGTTDNLERLGKLDPAYAEQLRLLEAKKALERLRYGEPEVSTGLEKSFARSAAQAGAPAVGAMLGGVPGWMAGEAGRRALMNPLALKLRLGLPAAEAVGRRGGGRTGSLMDRLSALELQRQEDQARALQGN